MNMQDPDVRHRIAQMRWQLRKLRHEHKSLCTGKPYTPSVETDIRRDWMRLYDWLPPSQRKELA